MRVRRRHMMRQSASGSTSTSKRWRRRQLRVTILEFASYLGALLLAVVVVWSIVAMVTGPGILTRINNSCGKNSLACGTEVGFLVPLLSVAAASAIFLFFRLRRVPSPVRQEGEDQAARVSRLPPSDIWLDVGRDRAVRGDHGRIARHSSDTRSAAHAVGGVGAGKTAVLVVLHQPFFVEHHARPSRCLPILCCETARSKGRRTSGSIAPYGSSAAMAESRTLLLTMPRKSGDSRARTTRSSSSLTAWRRPSPRVFQCPGGS